MSESEINKMIADSGIPPATKSWRDYETLKSMFVGLDYRVYNLAIQIITKYLEL